MRKDVALMLILLILFFFMNINNAEADMITLLGPVYVSKNHQLPAEKKSVFNFSASNPGEGVIIVRNGGDSGKDHRVGSASIILNGLEVAGPMDFNKNVDVLQYNVTFEPENEMDVVVRSCRDCEIEISVLAENSAPERPARPGF
ncbi:MAG TPA: hypothetical protein VJM57_01030 [Thermodesulfobacteriota bacterium]|nr:hypothetical protein [Thermodesulfobacteriota bacterium]